MKIFYYSLIILIFSSCGSESVATSCFQNLSFSEVINLNNAEFIDVQVPGTHTIFSRSGRNLILIRRTSTEYKAFDLECPERNCSSSMAFDGLKFKCSCHNKEYNSLSGSPIDGEGCFALEYFITDIGNNSLQISR